MCQRQAGRQEGHGRFCPALDYGELLLLPLLLLQPLLLLLRVARRRGKQASKQASMVLILHHILIAAVQFFRRGQQVFLKAEDATPASDTLQVGGPAFPPGGVGVGVGARIPPKRKGSPCAALLHLSCSCALSC